jgi:hypothetical protein
MLNRCFVRNPIVQSLLAVVLLLFLTDLLASGPTVAIGKKTRTAFSVIQTVPINASTASFTLTSGKVGQTGNGLQIQPDNNAASTTASTIASVPVMAYSSGSATKDAIIAQATSWLLPYAASLTTSLKSWMAINNYKAGSFIYEQEVVPQGTARSMKLVWQLAVSDTGRGLYGAPRLIDADPTYVYVTYTPKSVATGLPSSWAYSGAGILKWQLRKRDGTPQTSWASVDTNGAYDAPTSNGVDIDFGLKCLADKSSSLGCPTAYIDTKTLITNTASMGAIIDYVRQVAPVYDSTIDASSGATIQTPRVSVSIDTRTLTPTDCTNTTYRNTGSYGFTLNSNVDRYTVNEDMTTPQFVQRFTSTSTSPTSSYDLTVSTTLSSTLLQSQVINPFDTSAGLVAVSVVPYLTYLAPLTVADTSDIGVISTSTAANFTYNTYWNGRTFVIKTYNHDRGTGFYNDLMTVNVPLCQVESAKITLNSADDQQLIAINNQPVTATDSWATYGYYMTANGSYGSLPGNKNIIPYLTSPYWSISGYDPEYGYYSNTGATTSVQTYTNVCLYDYAESGCGGWGIQAAGLATTYFYLREIGGRSGDSWIPIDFTSKLINGSNQILMQQGVAGWGSAEVQIEIKLKDY